MGLTASSLGCRKRNSARHPQFSSIGDVNTVHAFSDAEDKNSSASLLNLFSRHSEKNNQCYDEIKKNYSNYLKLSSTSDSLEFVHGEKKPNTRIYGVDEHAFQFHHLIDTGGFGFVFKATKKNTQVPYALKVQPMEFMAHLTSGKRRANEVSIQMEKTVLATCNGHPFIVQLDYAFCTLNYAVLAIEYVPGGTLSRLIMQSPAGRISLELARLYTSEIAMALNFMHEKGVIYRDVKPSNILICLDGHIKVCDCGLAGSLLVKKKSSRALVVDDGDEAPKLTDDDSESSEDPEITEDEENELDGIRGDLRKVRRRTLCGTAGYRPLEMIGERFVDYASRSGYDEKVDWFALGVTVFTMLCGRRPFPTKRMMMQSGVSSPSITRRRSSFDTKSDAAERAAIRKAMKDIEFKCIMSEVVFPDYLRDHPEAVAFVESLIARDPKDRPGYGGIKSHPWFSEFGEFDAEIVKSISVPDWVMQHAQKESTSQPNQLRRNSMIPHKHRTEQSLNQLIKEICAQMMNVCHEDGATHVARWTANPSSSTKDLFRHWTYISDDAVAMELSASQETKRMRIERRKMMRRATQ